jgi:hypothetical protein
MEKDVLNADTPIKKLDKKIFKKISSSKKKELPETFSLKEVSTMTLNPCLYKKR